MLFRIDLKIFLFFVLFYFTKQIEIYTLMFLFAFIHELGHLAMGILVGMKPQKLDITPCGVSISFKAQPKYYNKKILNGNLLEMKKIIVAIAGPITNFIIIIISKLLNAESTIVYANILLIIFNLIPIYPLDGGRILNGILHILFGKRRASFYIRNISFITLILITFAASIGILYLENIAVFIIIMFLWFLYIRQENIESKREEIYRILDNTFLGK